MTLEEACAMLEKVNAMINGILSGQHVSDLTVGSHEFSRRFQITTPSMSELLKIRRDLMDYLAALCPSNPQPTFRKHAHIPLITTKRPV